MKRKVVVNDKVQKGYVYYRTEPVGRHFGGHKRDAFLTETFGRFVECVPVCPEVECGFGTPREAMRLVRAGPGVRLLTIRGMEAPTPGLYRVTNRPLKTLTGPCASLTSMFQSEGRVAT